MTKKSRVTTKTKLFGNSAGTQKNQKISTTVRGNHTAKTSRLKNEVLAVALLTLHVHIYIVDR